MASFLRILNSDTELLGEVPAEVRKRILSGLRWTLWISTLAAPFSYGTSILLARTSPEVIGTYGLLQIYLSLVTSFLYLGGDAVVIKFLPELPINKRFPFLLSYYVVNCVWLSSWLVAATLWPGMLGYVFGNVGRTITFQALGAILSPVYLLFLLLVGALKGMLAFRHAQMLLRLLTISQFVAFATLFFGFPSFLATYYNVLIWCTYLFQTVLAIAIGLRYMLRLLGSPRNQFEVRFLLPPGFWSYTLSTQQVSMLGFLLLNLNDVLILNFAGLATLGKYVAIFTISIIIKMVNNFFLDVLLPSLTNLLALKEFAAASQVFSMYWRILLIINIVACSGIMILARPLSALLGPEYVDLRFVLILLVLLMGLSNPGRVGGVILSSIGKQQQSVWVALGQLALFTVLFFGLWPQWHLLGAVLADGISLLASSVVLLIVAKHSGPIEVSVARDYIKFGIVMILASAVAVAELPLSLASALAVWLGAIALFLALARYGVVECIGLIRPLISNR